MLVKFMKNFSHYFSTEWRWSNSSYIYRVECNCFWGVYAKNHLWDWCSNWTVSEGPFRICCGGHPFTSINSCQPIFCHHEKSFERGRHLWKVQLPIPNLSIESKQINSNFNMLFFSKFVSCLNIIINQLCNPMVL